MEFNSFNDVKKYFTESEHHIAKKVCRENNPTMSEIQKKYCPFLTSILTMKQFFIRKKL